MRIVIEIHKCLSVEDIHLALIQHNNDPVITISAIIMSTPLGGGHIIFAFSAVRRPGVRRPTWFPDVLGNSSYPIFTKFGMQVYWVNSLYGIAFGDDSSIANWVIATLLLLSISLVSRHFKECY